MLTVFFGAIDMSDHPRTVEEIAEDYRARREGLLRALTEGEARRRPREDPARRDRRRHRRRRRAGGIRKSGVLARARNDGDDGDGVIVSKPPSGKRSDVRDSRRAQTSTSFTASAIRIGKIFAFTVSASARGI